MVIVRRGGETTSSSELMSEIISISFWVDVPACVLRKAGGLSTLGRFDFLYDEYDVI